MRIDSVGIYNNRGLIQDKSNQKSININKPDTKNIKPEISPKTTMTGQVQPAKLLSSAETAQIKQLFGKFKLSELSQTNKIPDIGNRPGQFIDIVV
jgi:hypothetical protein